MIWSSSPRARIGGAHLVLVAVTLSSASVYAEAPPPILFLPVACDLAKECSIQKYFDRASGPERLDYRCGTLTTDGHDGLDIRLRRTPDMVRNIPVVAAADGIVLRIRDGVADANVRITGGVGMDDRQAGNAVIIDHGNGWVTQYSHLKRGSVAVSPGAAVKAGTPLGAIGMSGNAEFPHVHFEVRRDGVAVDPFAHDTREGCAASRKSLWSDRALSALAYREGEVLDVGFAADRNAALEMRHAMVATDALRDPAHLILWGAASGARDGDEQHFIITVPNGERILDHRQRVVRGGLDWVGFAGVRRPAGGWARGRYSGHYSLIRNEKIVGHSASAIEL